MENITEEALTKEIAGEQNAQVSGIMADLESEFTEEEPKPEEPKPKYIEYKIVKGDTLTAIAKKYGTTIAVLKKLNNIKNVNLIYAGDLILIPEK